MKNKATGCFLLHIFEMRPNALICHSILGSWFSWWLKDCGWSMALATVFQTTKMGVEYLLIFSNPGFMHGEGPSWLLCDARWVSTLVVDEKRNSPSAISSVSITTCAHEWSQVLLEISFPACEVKTSYVCITAKNWLHCRNRASCQLW